MHSLLAYAVAVQLFAFLPMAPCRGDVSLAALTGATKTISNPVHTPAQFSLQLLGKAKLTVPDNQNNYTPVDSSLIRSTKEDNYCLTGNITWKTNSYKLDNQEPSFPLINAKVCIYNDAGTVATARTNDEGDYKFNLRGNQTLWDSLSDYRLKVVLTSDEAILYTRKIDGEIQEGINYFISEGYAMNVDNENVFVAGKGDIPINKEENSNDSFVLDMCYDSAGYTGQFFQLYTMIQMYNSHAAELDRGISGKTIPTCNLLYPCEVAESFNGFEYNYIAEYDYDTSMIKVPLGRYNKNNPRLYSYSSWDLIGHEYGHHLAQHLGFPRFSWGKHSSNKNDCQSAETKGTKSQAENGRNLAWIESWPTFFSIAAQKSFPDLFRDNISCLGDDRYDAYNLSDKDKNGNVVYTDMADLAYDDYAGGDACEESIMRFLYQLWDGVPIGNVNTENSEKELWADAYYASQSGIENFYQFYTYISYHHSEEEMRELAYYNKITASGFYEFSLRSWELVWSGGRILKLTNENGNETEVESYRYRLSVSFEDSEDGFLLNGGNYIVRNNSYTLIDSERELVGGKKVFVTIEKQAYNVADSTVYSTFLSEPIEVTFPEYVPPEGKD